MPLRDKMNQPKPSGFMGAIQPEPTPAPTPQPDTSKDEKLPTLSCRVTMAEYLEVLKLAEKMGLDKPSYLVLAWVREGIKAARAGHLPDNPGPARPGRRRRQTD